MNEMRKLMEAVENLTEVKVNYDSWKTAVPKNLNEYHIAILQLMSDGQSRQRATMIRQATGLDANPISSGGFAGWNKLDYDLYKKGLLDVVDIRGGQKIFQINAHGLKALKLTEAHQGGKTEHSGAKHGKGAYYGRKKDAKKDSNKNRRANDKKTVDENFEHYGSGAEFIPVVVDDKEVGVVWKEGEGDWHAEYSRTGSSWGMIDSYEDAVELIQGEAMEDIEEAYQGGRGKHSNGKKGKAHFILSTWPRATTVCWT